MHLRQAWQAWDPGHALAASKHASHRRILNGLVHVCRLCGRTLTTLGNLHMYMEGGHMRMGLCVIHKQLIEELRQDIAAAFTCLSGLILRNESGWKAPPPVWSPHFPHALYCRSLAAGMYS